MSFIDDMNIGKKLMGGFLIVLLILVAVAGLGYMNLQDAAARQNSLHEKMQGTENLALTNAALEKMRGDIYRYIAVPADRPATSTSLAAQVEIINDNMKEFRTRPLSAADIATLDKFDTAWATMLVTQKRWMPVLLRAALQSPPVQNVWVLSRRSLPVHSLQPMI
jgi:hypothetical protein